MDDTTYHVVVGFLLLLLLLLGGCSGGSSLGCGRSSGNDKRVGVGQVLLGLGGN